jgi:hypothetical protein
MMHKCTKIFSVKSRLSGMMIGSIELVTAQFDFAPFASECANRMKH